MSEIRKDERPKPEQDKKGRFISGNSGGGRPKGARNKFSEEFIEALHDSFLEHGRSAIEEVREEDPVAFLKLIASLVPRNMNVTVNEFDHMSEEDLIRRLRELGEAIRPLLDELPEAGSRH